MASGSVQRAVREHVKVGEPLATPTGGRRFSIADYRPESLVLVLGAKQTPTPLPWQALEEIPDLLRGRGWVKIGGVFSLEGEPGTLDEHLKRYRPRATAGWVAAVLERARVIEIDRSRPAHVRLLPDW